MPAGPAKAVRVKPTILMGEAIAKKDLVRIRSGSPGIRSGATKFELSNGKSFATEMKA